MGKIGNKTITIGVIVNVFIVIGGIAAAGAWVYAREKTDGLQQVIIADHETRIRSAENDIPQIKQSLQRLETGQRNIDRTQQRILDKLD